MTAMAIRATLTAVSLLAPGLAALGCDGAPPIRREAATGVFTAEPSCVLSLPTHASVYLEDHVLEVTTPGPEGIWRRGVAFLGAVGQAGCVYAAGQGVVRVQYGPADQAGVRPLFLESLDLPAALACSSCDPTDCIEVPASTVEKLYLWCDAP